MYRDTDTTDILTLTHEVKLKILLTSVSTWSKAEWSVKCHKNTKKNSQQGVSNADR